MRRSLAATATLILATGCPAHAVEKCDAYCASFFSIHKALMTYCPDYQKSWKLSSNKRVQTMQASFDDLALQAAFDDPVTFNQETEKFLLSVKNHGQGDTCTVYTAAFLVGLNKWLSGE
jgi:hypothetical protein